MLVSTKTQSIRGLKPRPNPKEMCSKTEVLNYRFPPVVERISEELKISERQALSLFIDVLRFLFMCATDSKQRSFSPSKKIDDGWHCFIMFTAEYRRFCHQNFGFFIDHHPFTKADRVARRAKPGPPTYAVALKLYGKLSLNWGNPMGIAHCVVTNDGGGGGQCRSECTDKTGEGIKNGTCTVDCEASCKPSNRKILRASEEGGDCRTCTNCSDCRGGSTG